MWGDSNGGFGDNSINADLSAGESARGEVHKGKHQTKKRQSATEMSPRMPPSNELLPVSRGGGGAGGGGRVLNREGDISDYHHNDVVYSGSRNSVERPLTTQLPVSSAATKSSTFRPSLSTIATIATTTVQSVADINRQSSSEVRIINSDPEDALNLPKGVTYQQSVTMVAQLFPAIKAEPSNIIWGLPTLVWGILIGCSVLAVLSLTTVFLCCWLIPRSRKFLSPTRCSSTRAQVTDRSGPRISIHSTESAGDSEHQRAPGREIIMAHSNKNNGMSMNGGSGAAAPLPHHALMYHQSPPQYNPPPAPKANTICTQGAGTTFVTPQQLAQQQQYYQMQAAYQKQHQKQNYCAQIMQQQQHQNYHTHYHINPSAGGIGATTYQGCSKHSGSSSSNDNSPKVSNNSNQNGNNKNHHHGENKGIKRHGCGGGVTVKNSTAVATNSTNSEGHKSMWAINNLHSSHSGLSDMELAAYRTRSLPSWGKGNKQRPVSTADDLEELYAKVNFSKKRRNRMRNDEAAIIALCRSKSQNLSGIPLDRDGIVVYDERTAL